MLNFLPSLPLASAFLVLMVCIYFYAAEERRVWALLGVAFTIVYTVMASINFLSCFDSRGDPPGELST